MPLFSFLKITNNKDPCDFTIECTSMKNGRARISCLRTNLFAWEDAGCVSHFRPVWRYFFLDYSYYVCEKKEFCWFSKGGFRHPEIMRPKLFFVRYLVPGTLEQVDATPLFPFF